MKSIVQELLMKHLLFSFLTIIITLEANCQKIEVDKTVNIGGDRTTFYSNDVNCFSITASRDPLNTLIFKTTQGKLELVDSTKADGHLRLSGLKNGKVNIQVYRKNGTHLEFLNYKDFDVTPLGFSKEEKELWENPPVIDIEGYGRYNDDCKERTIPLHILKGARKFNINSPYQITNMDIIIVFPGFSDNTSISILNSNYFNDEFLRVINYLKAGEYITLDDIKIKDSKGKEYSLELINLKITDN